MTIEFRNTTQVNNNLRTEMFFDGIRVAEIHCTPHEFDLFRDGLQGGIALACFDEVVVSQA
jgi:hypothetical protein